VIVPWRGDRQLRFPATVTAVCEDGTFDIRFDDST
jgi:hypothetical protein